MRERAGEECPKCVKILSSETEGFGIDGRRTNYKGWSKNIGLPDRTKNTVPTYIIIQT